MSTNNSKSYDDALNMKRFENKKNTVKKWNTVQK